MAILVTHLEAIKPLQRNTYFLSFCISGITTSDCRKMGFKMRECNALEAPF